MADQSDVAELVFSMPPLFLYGTVSGFVGVFVVFHLVRDVMIPKLAPASFQEKLASLPTRKDKVFFYSTFTSMVHALVQSAFDPMYVSLGYSQEHNENRVTYFDVGGPAFFSGIFNGYLMADFIICGPKDLGPAYCLHHLSAIVVWTGTALVGSMQWYACMLQFCEFSTIFMNLRQWVLTAGYSSSSPIGIAVTLSFFLSFFAVRVVPLPTMVYQWPTTDFPRLAAEKGMGVALFSSTALVIHVSLQSFWFLLMVQKIVKIVLGGGKKKKKEE